MESVKSIAVKSDIIHNIYSWTVRKFAAAGKWWLGKKFRTGFDTWKWNSILTAEWTCKKLNLPWKAEKNQCQTECKKKKKQTNLVIWEWTRILDLSRFEVTVKVSYLTVLP